jgi:hypothetical protein
MSTLVEKLEALAKECGDSKFYAIRRIRDRIRTPDAGEEVSSF